MIKSNQTSAIQYLSLLSVAMHWKLGTSSLRFSFFVLVGNIFISIRFFFYWFYGAIFSTAAEANHFSFWYIDLQIRTFSQIPFRILIFFPDSLIPNWLAAVLWQIRRKTLEALGANSHFPLPCPSLLRSKWSTLPSVQLSPAWTKGSDGTVQDLKVGIHYCLFFLGTIFLFSKVMDNRDNVLFPQ